MKTRLISRPLSSFLWVTCQCIQCCIVAVAVGWLTNKTGAGKKAALTVELNKSIVHKTSSNTFIPTVQPYIEQTNFLLLPQVPSCNWLRLQHVRYTEGVKSYSQRSRSPNFVQSTIKLWKIDSQRGCSCDYRAYGSDTPLFDNLVHNLQINSSRGVHSNKYSIL